MPNLTVTKSNIDKIKNMKDSKTPFVCLIHAIWCGHCVAFKPEWNKFKKSKYNTADIESSHIDDFKANPISKKLLPKDGQLYFPMIIISICGKVYEYKGNRTSDDMQEFITSKTEVLKKKVVKPLIKAKPKTKVAKA